MFKHGVLPIVDYEHNGVYYRWLREKKLIGPGYIYHLYELDADQPSIAHNFNKENHTINKVDNHGNPFIVCYFWKFINVANRYCHKQYQSSKLIARFNNNYSLETSDENATLTIYETSIPSNIHRESIFSVTLEAGITICTALVLKKIEESIGTDRKIANYTTPSLIQPTTIIL